MYVDYTKEGYPVKVNFNDLKELQKWEQDLQDYGRYTLWAKVCRDELHQLCLQHAKLIMEKEVVNAHKL